MAWLVIAVAGVWIFLSALILVAICMQSSRLSQMEEAGRRSPSRARASRRASSGAGSAAVSNALE